jgi:hypothetical protein
MVKNFLKIIVTIFKNVNSVSYDKNQLCSQNYFFTKVFLENPKKDKNKCPNQETQNTFGKSLLH